MKQIKQLLRLLQINVVLARNGLDQLIVSIRLFSPLRFFIYLNPWYWTRKEKLSRGAALRKTLEELGPIFIKFGQALSTRSDVLPADLTKELRELQDNIPAFSSEQALAILAQAFGESPYKIFATFDLTPLACASIAQVHSATLKTGEKVVVKILRPNIRKIIEQDLSIIYTIANLAERYWPEVRRLKPKEIVREFEYSLLNELDLKIEAANASQLRRNFLNSTSLYIPEIFWNYTSQNILVMERIHGIPINDIASIQKIGINTKKLAALIFEILFTQVFRDCFFHADLHPGNIFVSPIHLENPQYICVDFGIVGTLNDQDKHYLAENLHAFLKRDYRRVALLHVESGWVASDTRIDEFESAIRVIFEPIFDKPLKSISFGDLMFRFLEVARRFNMEIQPQLALLQKTLLAVEGISRQLYPELDLWIITKPFLEKWLREQIGPMAFLRQLRDNLPFLVEHVPHMPQLLYETLALNKKQQQIALAQNNKKPHTPNDTFSMKQLQFFFFGVFTTLVIIGIFYLVGA